MAKPFVAGAACLLVAGMAGLTLAADGPKPAKVGVLLEQIRKVGPKGSGHQAAQRAWKKLSQLPADQLPAILSGMKGANVLAGNWIQAAAETVAGRRAASGGELPIAELKRFLADRSQAPRARRTAFEMIVRSRPADRETLIAGMLNDPSPELRFDAVALAIAKAAQLKETADQKSAVAAYRRALNAARNPAQIDEIAEKLREMKENVDLARHFGFVQRWKLIAPFDNANKMGFDRAYPPETKLDLSASYAGKGRQVRWQDYQTKNEYGEVDLNKAIGREKGAICYAHAEFHSANSRPVELRIGSTNANKIWLNGKLLTSNDVYHANTFIDQYTGRGQLKAGKNIILVKIAQNEQSEPWAQDWKFQLRVCDQYGTAVLSEDRPTQVSLPPKADSAR